MNLIFGAGPTTKYHKLLVLKVSAKDGSFKRSYVTRTEVLKPVVEADTSRSRRAGRSTDIRCI